jgi:hypothetical protein
MAHYQVPRARRTKVSILITRRTFFMTQVPVSSSNTFHALNKRAGGDMAGRRGRWRAKVTSALLLNGRRRTRRRQRRSLDRDLLPVDSHHHVTIFGSALILYGRQQHGRSGCDAGCESDAQSDTDAKPGPRHARGTGCGPVVDRAFNYTAWLRRMRATTGNVDEGTRSPVLPVELTASPSSVNGAAAGLYFVRNADKRSIS